MDSFELQDELNALAQDPSQYEIPNEHDFDSEDPTKVLEGLFAYSLLLNANS
jgi:hypothetical protein